MQLAVNYNLSSELLSEKLDLRHGDASQFLMILAFEIALKAVFVEAKGSESRSGHDYSEIWGNLPVEVTRDILEIATDRNAAHVDYDDISTLLNDFKRNFLKARYSYEVNRYRTEAEVTQISRNWANAGSPDDQADYLFHPMELEGLFFGLVKWFEQRTECSFDT